MRNLAGDKHSDAWCALELREAGIDMVLVDEPYGEPRTRVTGTLGGITFRRAWCYWIAQGCVPLDVAQRLYADPIGRTDVRVAGHCGCPPPEEWAKWFDGDEAVCIDPDGSQERECRRLVQRSKLLRAEDVPRFAATTDGLQAYVTSYHIDSAAGLRLFADAIRPPKG
jgi:hypothetical protein